MCDALPASQRVAAPRQSAPNAFLKVKDVLMFKRFLVALLACLAFAAFAADVNTASQADLEAVKGIGPAIATKILDERKKGLFKDWPDLVIRVKGIGETSAAKLSTAGLTVNGAGYAGAPAKTAPATATRPAATAKPTPTTTTPAAATAPPTPAAPAVAPAASSAKELKKAEADAKKADKAAKKAAKAASAASSAKK